MNLDGPQTEGFSGGLGTNEEVLFAQIQRGMFLLSLHHFLLLDVDSDNLATTVDYGKLLRPLLLLLLHFHSFSFFSFQLLALEFKLMQPPPGVVLDQNHRGQHKLLSMMLQHLVKVLEQQLQSELAVLHLYDVLKDVPHDASLFLPDDALLFLLFQHPPGCFPHAVVDLDTESRHVPLLALVVLADVLVVPPLHLKFPHGPLDDRRSFVLSFFDEELRRFVLPEVDELFQIKAVELLLRETYFVPGLVVLLRLLRLSAWE